jgi:hypothetical protein
MCRQIELAWYDARRAVYGNDESGHGCTFTRRDGEIDRDLLWTWRWNADGVAAARSYSKH